MLTPIAPPADAWLLDPVELRARLASAGLVVSESESEGLAAEATAEVAAALGFDPAYQEWGETFDGTRAPSLYMSARPVSVVSWVKGSGVTLDAATYRVDAREARIVRAVGGWIAPTVESVVSGSNLPAWEVRFFAGWWMPTQGGTRPDAAPVLDAAVARYAYEVAKTIQFRSDTFGAERMEISGVKLTLQGASVASADRQAAAAARGYVLEPPRGVLRWRVPVI